MFEGIAGKHGRFCLKVQPFVYNISETNNVAFRSDTHSIQFRKMLFQTTCICRLFTQFTSAFPVRNLNVDKQRSMDRSDLMPKSNILRKDPLFEHRVFSSSMNTFRIRLSSASQTHGVSQHPHI